MKKPELTELIYNQNKTFPLEDRHTAMYLHAQRMERELDELTSLMRETLSRLEKTFP